MIDRVVAAGHVDPLIGPDVASALGTLAANFNQIARPHPRRAD
jgi:hypothetical protein